MELYKILLPLEWRTLTLKRRTLGAALDEADGYVHLSTAQQVKETAAKHFKCHNNIVLVGCDTDLMKEPLLWEPSRSGMLFPHLYGRMDMDFVLWHESVCMTNGVHLFPNEIIST